MLNRRNKVLLGGFLIVFGVFLYLITIEKETILVPQTIVEEIPASIEIENPTTIGYSVEGRVIEAYTYGSGERNLLFVGGIHGGYEWNSVLLAYRLMEYLELNKDILPENISVTIVPVLNPDGLYDVVGREGRFAIADVPNDTGAVGTGRFNANNVDLNRNFDCKWQPESTWRGNTVSAGTSAFSEPEALALQKLVLENKPVMVAFFHSQSNAIYASECENGILPQTLTVMNTYASAAGYPAIDTFSAYSVTGDAEGWLASIGIPAITVELSTHESVEWEKNIKGIQALFALYSN